MSNGHGSFRTHQEREVLLNGERADEQVFLDDVPGDRGHRLRSHGDAVRVPRAAVKLGKLKYDCIDCLNTVQAFWSYQLRPSFCSHSFR